MRTGRSIQMEVHANGARIDSLIDETRQIGSREIHRKYPPHSRDSNPRSDEI